MRKIIKVNILGHTWKIRFLPYDTLNKEVGFNALGYTFTDRKCIDVCDHYEPADTERIIAHELAHAFICGQGRTFQKKFTQEEVAEFVAWSIDEMMKVKEQIMKARYEK